MVSVPLVMVYWLQVAVGDGVGVGVNVADAVAVAVDVGEGEAVAVAVGVGDGAVWQNTSVSAAGVDKAADGRGRYVAQRNSQNSGLQYPGAGRSELPDLVGTLSSPSDGVEST